jgi:Na+/proline symporter
MNWTLAGIGAYILFQVALGVWVSRRISSQEDYLLAGRSLGYVLATFSIFATWFGAETCVGAAGQVYGEGLSAATTEPYAYGLTLMLSGALFATALWRRRLSTLADLFRERFSPGVERLAALMLIPTSVCWAAAQVRAFGHVLATTGSFDPSAAIAAAAITVIAYTTFGGLLADAISDVVYGAALTVGLVVLLVAVVGDLGGVDAALQAAAAPRAAPPSPIGMLETMEAWALPVFGSVVAQELVSRISAARSAAVARRSALAAGAAYLVIGSIPVLLGLMAPALVTVDGHPEQVLPILAQRHLPPLGYTLFAGALVSAILSTVDSTLLVASSLATNNLLPALWPSAGDREHLVAARAAVVAFGLVAWAMAVHADSVSALIEHANGFGSGGIFVVVCFGLFTGIGRTTSAYAALAAGMVVYFAGLASGFAYAYLASLGSALGCYLAVSVGELLRGRVDSTSGR